MNSTPNHKRIHKGVDNSGGKEREGLVHVTALSSIYPQHAFHTQKIIHLYGVEYSHVNTAYSYLSLPADKLGPSPARAAAPPPALPP